MDTRRLGAALALAVLLAGVSGCARPVAGSPVAAPAGHSPGSDTRQPSGTRVPRGSSSQAKPPAADSTPGGSAGAVTVAVRKATDGYEICDLLSPEEIQQAVGGTLRNGEDYGVCVLQTDNPSQVLSMVVSVLTHNTDGERITVGGNTAFRAITDLGCEIDVALTDNADAIINALTVSVGVIDGNDDGCAGAQKLAEAAFAKIPNV